VSGAVDTVPALEKLAEKDPAFYMTLGRVGSPDARRIIERALRAPKPGIRAIAAAALQTQGQAVCQELQKAADGERDVEALAAQLFALANLRCPGAESLAMRQLRHREREVQWASLAILTRLPGPAHIEPLLALLQDEDAGPVSAVATALSRQPAEPAWVERLLAVARKTRHPEIIMAAIDRASAAGTPRCCSR